MVTTESARETTMSMTDLGLLILRLGVGATMIQAGLRKLFDFNNTAALMELGGWHPPKFATVMVSAAETAGGIGLFLGVVTPMAACAIIGAMLDAWAVNVSGGAFWSDPFNVPFMLVIAATAVLFAGPGAYSVDAAMFGRPTWSPRIALGLLGVAIAVAILTWLFLNGTNPIHFSRAV
jgi:putative oxidoreductase